MQTLGDAMESVAYDKSSVASIYNFASRLIGKTLNQATELPIDIVNKRNRGDLGKLVEVHYFKHNPPNNHDPDFPEAGVELKTTGVAQYKKKQKSGEIFKGKERLVLTSINFKTIGDESWYNSTLLHKCNLMLVLFYEYAPEVSVIDQKFIFKPLLIELSDKHSSVYERELDFILENAMAIPPEDLAQIKRDWESIRTKIASQKAHELSEGDTFYLGACRKGAGGDKETLKKQSESVVGAKGRAFALKQSYVSKLVQGHSKREHGLGVNRTVTFEDATKAKFNDYLGLSVEEISKRIGYDTSAKSRKRAFARRILEHSGQELIELKKAGIILKTVSLNKAGKCREDISFPAFKYLDIYNQSWEESEFADQVESKFLFVVFKVDCNGIDRLEKVLYWNMPYSDRLEAEKVWKETKRRIGIDARNLPKKSENPVAHVRPHGQNSLDTDEAPNKEFLVKKCFWLNGSYIAKAVSEAIT